MPEKRVTGETYDCEWCGEPFIASQATQRFCQRRPGGVLCRLAAWRKLHPTLSPPHSKPRPGWRAKRREFYSSTKIDDWLAKEAEATGQSRSRIIRDTLELVVSLTS